MRPMSFWLLIVATPCLAFSPLANTAVLLDVSPMGRQSAKSLDLTKIATHAEALLPSRSGVSYYRLRYLTHDPAGRSVVASGLLILPDGKLIRVISYQHGTSFSRGEAPSASTDYAETLGAAIAFGSMGYGVVAADYLGLGSNQGPHPYLIAASEARVTADLLLAAQEYCTQQGIKWAGELALVGYSEGAHATMALQRFLESDTRPPSLPAVGATVVGAGPYDLSGVTLDAALKAVSPLWSASTADLIYSLHSISPMAADLSDIFQPNYSTRIPDLFDGDSDSASVVGAFPFMLKDLLQPAFLQAVQTNPTHPLRLALAKNDVYDWTPRAPILFLHASGDTRVPYANSVKIFNIMKARGARVTLEDLGATLDHDEAYIPAMIRAEQVLK
jgi:pimeloyl-ACP methyl ester carboxylesterase